MPLNDSQKARLKTEVTRTIDLIKLVSADFQPNFSEETFYKELEETFNFTSKKVKSGTTALTMLYLNPKSVVVDIDAEDLPEAKQYVLAQIKENIALFRAKNTVSLQQSNVTTRSDIPPATSSSTSSASHSLKSREQFIATGAYDRYPEGVKMPKDPELVEIVRKLERLRDAQDPGTRNLAWQAYNILLSLKITQMGSTSHSAEFDPEYTTAKKIAELERMSRLAKGDGSPNNPLQKIITILDKSIEQLKKEPKKETKEELKVGEHRRFNK